MKLVLKDADFSQSGIVLPETLSISSGEIGFIVKTGEVAEPGVRTDRSHTDDFIATSKKILTNKSLIPVNLTVFLFTSNSPLPKVMLAKEKPNPSASVFVYRTLAAGKSVDLSSLTYQLVSGGDWSGSNVPYANASYYLIALAQSKDGVILTVQPEQS